MIHLSSLIADGRVREPLKTRGRKDAFLYAFNRIEWGIRGIGVKKGGRTLRSTVLNIHQPVMEKTPLNPQSNIPEFYGPQHHNLLGVGMDKSSPEYKL
jgi:hypothetical protein